MGILYCQRCDAQFEASPTFIINPWQCWCGGKHFTNDPSLRGPRQFNTDETDTERELLSSEALEGR